MEKNEVKNSTFLSLKKPKILKKVFSNRQFKEVLKNFAKNTLIY